LLNLYLNPLGEEDQLVIAYNFRSWLLKRCGLNSAADSNDVALLCCFYGGICAV